MSGGTASPRTTCPGGHIFGDSGQVLGVQAGL